ncbi:MAG TPA: SdiA-regulated domain-containing protein [Ignavibacteria bacterium]|nr:SdiA-regulated domain-containing protein [Ignavibacteria bacterium]HRK00431.1 SdiA-regulated domain-containing protein [Ignavibacteria bacterium]
MLKIIRVIFLSMIIISCGKKENTGEKNSGKKNPEKTNANKIVNDTSGLSHYNIDSPEPRITDLPSSLKEISGITFSPDDRLFGIQDESAIIYQIDISNGDIIKKFAVGNSVMKGDFEDIEYVNDKFYLIKSNGELFEFKEAGNNEYSDYILYETGLKQSSDVEGLCYDEKTNSLLLACKGKSGTGKADEKAIYSFSPDSKILDPKPKFTIPLSQFKKEFNPSGIKKHPVKNTFFVIAANGNEVIELSEEGLIIDRHSLNPKIHEQPEGIAFSKNNDLLISNEGKSGKGYIVIYPYQSK